VNSRSVTSTHCTNLQTSHESHYAPHSSVSSCTAHNVYITMDLTYYAATPLHVHNDLILLKF